MPTTRTLRRLVPALAALVACASAAAPAAAQSGDPRVDAIRAAIDVLDDYAQPPACDQQPDPARWEDAGTPDQGRAEPLISAHRGALTLAPENTVASYEYAFAFGADGVQTNQPERIVAAAGRRVHSRIVTHSDRGHRATQVCLVNARNGLGFPTKRIELRKLWKRTAVIAGRGGCADLPAPSWRGALAVFAGDDAVQGTVGFVHDRG
jgi:hypothetical protein